MNALKKFFRGIQNTSTKKMKTYVTNELIKNLPEYQDHTLYILKNIYSLITSENSDDRHCGAKILGALETFEYTGTFSVDSCATDYVYLQHKELRTDGKEEWDRTNFKKKLKLQHVNTKFLDSFLQPEKAVERPVKIADLEDRRIENVNDFFAAINLILWSPDWYKRHGAFLAYEQIFRCFGPCSSNGGRVDANNAVDNAITNEIMDNNAITNEVMDNNAITNDTITNKIMDNNTISNDTTNNNTISNTTNNSNTNNNNTNNITANGSRKTETAIEKDKIKLHKNLFNKAYEILKNDRVTDFVDNRASAPVREAAADLLKAMYPHILDQKIIHLLVEFLRMEDWQIQFSGLLGIYALRAFIDRETALLLHQVLLNLLENGDEDIKHLSAELIRFVVERDKVPDIKKTVEICWEQLNEEVDLSHSKGSVIALLETIYRTYSLPEPLFFSPLYPCFSSPIQEIRSSAVRICDFFENEELAYLLGEAVLLSSTRAQSREALTVLRHKKLTTDFGKHFLRLAGLDASTPYSENDFVCYDESFFTRDGMRSLGIHNVIDAKAELFEVILDIPGVEPGEPVDLLGQTFASLYAGRWGGTERSTPRKIEEIVAEHIEGDFKAISALKKMPAGEFRKIYREPAYSSAYPLCNIYALEYLRMLVCRHIGAVEDPTLYVRLEISENLLAVFSRVFIDKNPHLDAFVFSSFEKIAAGAPGLRNFVVFFRVLGRRLISSPAFQKIREHPARLAFFAHTLQFYLDEEDPFTAELFREALAGESLQVLRIFISQPRYNAEIVRHLLRNFSTAVFEGLIEHSNPIYSVLFVKTLLKKRPSLLSTIIPFIQGSPDSTVPEDLRNKILEEQKDTNCLLEPTKIQDYVPAIPISCELRQYQKEGIKWMSFLNRFNLNGILADDMGLGKTVQVLTYVLSELHGKDGRALIICPSTLTCHWKDEAHGFFNKDAQIFSSKEKSLKKQVIIASFDSVRKEKIFQTEKWRFLVIDEGHILKSRDTVLYSMVTQIEADCKFILTGTPVQNSVSDLFSLFNVIMPGYLTNESEFVCKVTDRNVEQMSARLEILQKRVLPFILRRLKSAVLTDLPPKIVKDVLIKLENGHHDAYAAMQTGDEDAVRGYGDIGPLSALAAIRGLVKCASHPRHFVSGAVSSKTEALREIFAMCEEKKILVFFQLRKTIDFVLEELGLTSYERLDGSVPAAARSAVVSRFNTEAVQYMFLTTAVGGLGLNLTAADTVIFYEHDWNPFNDLQAMDRAHRLGQKSVVNIFRLISKDTIEEKVMNYQNFKMFVANSLVTQQNMSVETMDTKELLEKFE